MLETKVEKSKEVLKRSFSKWDSDMSVMCDFGKDSTVVLHLARELCGEVPAPVLFIDHQQHFPEVYRFKEKMSKIWNLKIFSVTPKKSYEEVKEDKGKCCYWLRTEPFLRAMKEQKWKACCIATRSETNPEKLKDRHVVKRKGENFYRVRPLLHWSSRDIWRHIRLSNLPYCSLYDKGYRNVGCIGCTSPVMPVETRSEGEAVDKQKITERLHSLGYF